MILKDDQVELRFLVEADAYTSVNWRNNPKIWEQTLNAPDRTITIADELEWINKVISEEDSFRFAILYESIYVGNVQLTNMKDSESYYGIFIGDTSYWGKGIAKKATRLVLHYAFTHANLNKVKLRVRVNHEMAQKLYKHIGFKEVANDEDLIYMEITKEDFLRHV